MEQSGNRHRGGELTSGGDIREIREEWSRRGKSKEAKLGINLALLGLGNNDAGVAGGQETGCRAPWVIRGTSGFTASAMGSSGQNPAGVSSVQDGSSPHSAPWGPSSRDGTSVAGTVTHGRVTWGGVFFHPYTFCLCVSFILRWVSWRQHIAYSMGPATLCWGGLFSTHKCKQSITHHRL